MRRKIASYLLVATLLFPLGLSLIHAVHEHENQICLAETESHIHTETNDCETLHYFSQSLGDPYFNDEESPLDFRFIPSNFNISESIYFKFNFATSGRAPPVFKIV